MPTPVRLHRLTPRGTAACALAIASLVAMACTDGTSNDPAPKVPPAPPADPTLLVIALPAGVEVGVDDQKPEAPPLAPLPLEPGTHTLHLVTACQQLELPVELAAGTTTRIDPARAKGLELATLEVVVRDLDGKPLTHTVSIGDTVVGAGQGSSKVTVPACQSRVKVASEGLGGFIEDVNFDEQSEVRREVCWRRGRTWCGSTGGLHAGAARGDEGEVDGRGGGVDVSAVSGGGGGLRSRPDGSHGSAVARMPRSGESATVLFGE